jgi:DNA-binding transcriptional ArsR family regulator
MAGKLRKTRKALEAHPTRKGILTFLRTHGDLTTDEELRTALEMRGRGQRDVFRYHLNLLVDGGLVAVERTENYAGGFRRWVRAAGATA